MLERLRLRNFRVYVDQTIEFRKGINAIVGPNGSGKTTILEAIEFALFKRVKRKEKDVNMSSLIRHGQTKAELELVFRAPVNNRTYAVWRKIVPGKTMAELRELVDGEGRQKWKVVQTAPKRVDSAIEQLLGMDRDGFAATVYVRQGDINLLSRQPPRKKRELLRNMMGLGVYEDLRKKAKRLLRDLDSLRSEHEADINQLREILELLPTEEEIAAARTSLTRIRILVEPDSVEPLEKILVRVQDSRSNVMTRIATAEKELSASGVDRRRELAQNLSLILDQIPGVAEEQVKPMIREEARRIFLDIFGDRYSDLEIADDYDITLWDIRGNRVALSSASGGEDVCVNFALRVAVNTALQRVAAEKRLMRPLGLLIMDEPGMGLDSQRRRWLPDAISTLKSIDQVIVVTHMTELKDAADVTITLQPQGKNRQPRVIVET